MTQEPLPLPELIHIQELPVVPLLQRALLPTGSGIYFVLNNEGEVQYIGRTINLHQRWASHHRLRQFAQRKDYRIAWLLITNPALLKGIEQACIAYFDPPDNAMRTKAHGEDYHPSCSVSFRLTQEDKYMLQGLAARDGVSDIGVIRMLLRTEARRLGLI